MNTPQNSELRKIEEHSLGDAVRRTPGTPLNAQEGPKFFLAGPGAPGGRFDAVAGRSGGVSIINRSHSDTFSSVCSGSY